MVAAPSGAYAPTSIDIASLGAGSSGKVPDEPFERYNDFGLTVAGDNTTNTSVNGTCDTMIIRRNTTIIAYGYVDV